MKLKVEPIKSAIGAIVHVDRAALLNDEVAQQCMALVEQHGVLVFPRIGLSDDEQRVFTGKLGTRVNFTTSAPGASASGGYTISLDPKLNPEPEYVLGTFFYHMDGLSMAGIPPPKASVLSCRKAAAHGGQTEFASTYAAYESLSTEEQTAYESLRVVHSVVASVREFADAAQLEPRKRSHRAERPLVWHHRSGRKSLLIGYTADHVIGMPQAEGRALLVRLMEWAGQPAFSYRHHWQEGDLVVWDNCGALHRVIPYAADSGRNMNRTSVAGVEMLA